MGVNCSDEKTFIRELLDFAFGLWQKGGVVSQMPRKTPKCFVAAVISVVVLGAQIALLSAAQLACTPARPDTEGPFYEPNAPERNRSGRGLAEGTRDRRTKCSFFRTHYRRAQSRLFGGALPQKV